MVQSLVSFLRRHADAVVLIMVTAVAAIPRLWRFGGWPVGLNQDEMSAGYEALSLLTTHADRWGIHLPVYFLGWGSGQNVLYSYLDIPFVDLLGLTAVAVRLPALLTGIASIPLLYVVAKNAHGRGVGLLAALTLALSTWHILLSRWALESNLLPFCLLLGLWLFTRAIRPSASNVSRIIVFVPFGIALYAYGLSVVTVPVLVGLLVLSYWRQTLGSDKRGQWCLSLAITVAISVPFVLFAVKNYLVKTTLPFESYLPFGLPLLRQTRLDQVSHDPVLLHNLRFVMSGFNDGTSYNTVPGFLPLALGVLLFALVGLAVLIRRAMVTKGLRAPVFLLAFIAYCPTFLVIPTNVNHANALFTPIAVFAAVGVTAVARRIRNIRVSSAVYGGYVAYLVGVCLVAMTAYYSPDFLARNTVKYNPYFGQALLHTDSRTDGEPILVTSSIDLNYLQTAWYLRLPPMEFIAAGATLDDPDFKNYKFSLDRVDTSKPFYFVIRKTDPMPCLHAQGLYSADGWLSGHCNGG